MYSTSFCLQNHVAYLHEEFLKLPSFPRKALETEFDMYGGPWGKELFGMDCLHKYSWTKVSIFFLCLISFNVCSFIYLTVFYTLFLSGAVAEG